MNNKVKETEEQTATDTGFVDENGNPMPEQNYLAILFRKLDGEWTEIDYPYMKGKVEKDGQYKIILSGKEYNLQNIKHPKRSIDSSKNLTKTLKEEFLYFVEVDLQTVAAMPNESLIEYTINCDSFSLESDLEYCREILKIIDSKEVKDFLSLYTLSNGRKSVANNLYLDRMVRVKNNVCGYHLMATIPNRKKIKWKRVVDTIYFKYNNYRRGFQDSKSDHQLVLYILLDLAVSDYLDHKDSDRRERFELMVYDETITVNVNNKYRDLLIKGAEYVTERYRIYHEKYSICYDEATISRMALLDVGMNKFEYKEKHEKESQNSRDEN